MLLDMDCSVLNLHKIQCSIFNFVSIFKILQISKSNEAMFWWKHCWQICLSALACDIYSFYSLIKGKKKQFLYSNKEMLGQMGTGDTIC